MTDKGNKTMKNKEKFIKAITAILGIFIMISPILIAASFGAVASAEIKKELNRWNIEYLSPNLEFYEDYAEWKAGINFQEEEVPEEYIEFVLEYFPIFVQEVEAKLALAEKYCFLIGTKYKEFYTRILHWCWFADDYFLGGI